LASYGSGSVSDSGDEADGLLSPPSWLPWQSSETFDHPPEFDEDGQCLFLSPYSALSREEKQRAEWMELEEVSAGVVRSKFASDGDEEAGDGVVEEYDGFEDPDMAHNATRKKIKLKGQSHPILKLLKQGEDKWNERINGQSKTLEEAVDKYVSKWGRQPPKGFDRW
jgi:beta-1,2-xylosyltransferase